MNRRLLHNVIVWTMDEADHCFHGWLSMRDGRIDAMGEGSAPDTTPYDEVTDGHGGIVTPGLIDVHSHLGLFGDSIGFEGADGNEDTDPVTPQLRAIDGVNPLDRGFAEARAAGVTAVAVSPGSANPIGGQIALLHTAGRRVDDMVLKAPLAVKFAFGENPKTVYHDKDDTPVTRMATAALIREQLYKAKEYLFRKDRAADDPDEEAPDYDSKLEALLPLLRGEAQAHFHAHRADDIFTALRVAREFDLQPVIIHGTEGHLVADLLAADGVPVVSGPFMTDRSKPELQNLTDRAPGLLCRAGVETAITVDHPETPLRLLQTALLQAVKAGMDKTDALRSVTSTAAHVIGMADRIGCLVPGMEADVVLWSGDPLDFFSEVQAVWISGVPEYRRDV